MYVQSMWIDRWIDNVDVGKRIDQPSWYHIESHLMKLDGSIHTLITLDGSNDSQMLIGGGENGKYIVTATFDNEKFYTLVNENGSEELVEMVAGGQLGEYPMNFCVDQQLMLSAVKEFFTSGKIDDTADWLGE